LCGVRALSKGRSTVMVRDIDAFGRRVQLRWRKRRWRCAEQRCAVKTWTETTDAIAARAVLTQRARVQACRRVGRDGHSSPPLVARIADRVDVRSARLRHAKPVQSPAGTAARRDVLPRPRRRREGRWPTPPSCRSHSTDRPGVPRGAPIREGFRLTGIVKLWH